MTEKKEILDLIIIGGGPAGITAGVYAARKKLNTLIITKDFGGQSVVSETIENWTGEIEIKGMDLAKKLKDHIKHYESETFKIKEYSFVTKIEGVEKINNKNIFKVVDNTGNEYLTKTILVTSGAKRRKLPAKGADIFEHKGLTYCASCDGPMFAGKDVAVVGGGNSAFESASQLMAYAKSVTILQRSDSFRAEPTMVDNTFKNPIVKGITNVSIIEVFGDNFVKGIKYNDKDGNEQILNVEGIFVEIGSIPATDFVPDDLVEKNNFNQIIINHKTAKTSKDGIWAAGDASDSVYKQNSIAMGDATKAIEDLYGYLQN